VIPIRFTASSPTSMQCNFDPLGWGLVKLRRGGRCIQVAEFLSTRTTGNLAVIRLRHARRTACRGVVPLGCCQPALCRAGFCAAICPCKYLEADGVAFATCFWTCSAFRKSERGLQLQLSRTQLLQSITWAVSARLWSFLSETHTRTKEEEEKETYCL